MGVIRRFYGKKFPWPQETETNLGCRSRDKSGMNWRVVVNVPLVNEEDCQK